MAAHLLNVVVHSLQKLTLASACRTTPVLIKTLTPSSPSMQLLYVNRRNVNFFNKLPTESLWKGITSVSNAGKKRGRAKRISRKNIKDLNRGQVLGIGKANIVWPGLTAPIIQGRELVEQQRLPEDPERQIRLHQLRDQMVNLRRSKFHALDRGWSGTKMPGRSIGPPDPIGEETFEGFDTKVLQNKLVFTMKGNVGRSRRLVVFVITGNRNGLAGFAMGKSVDSTIALRKAKNRAGQKLMHFKIFRGHTVYHDFFSQFGKTKVFISQKPEGFGLVCHRAIKTVCEVIGIKNLYGKIEGSTNVQNVVKAFILGLLRQKTHKQIVEEKRLHLVEFRKENGYFPTLVASPSECRKPSEIKHDEVLNFTQHCLEDRVILQRKKFPPFYTKHKSWQLYLKKQEKIRNHDKIRIQLKAEYGEVRSFLTEQYPECKPNEFKRKEKEVEAE